MAVVQHLSRSGRVCGVSLTVFKGSIVWSLAIDAQANAGVNHLSLACRCLNLFRFDVNRLLDFIEAAPLQTAITDDVGGELKFFSVGVGLNFRVEPDGSAPHLNVQRACEKECSEGKRPTQAGTSPHEI